MNASGARSSVSLCAHLQHTDLFVIQWLTTLHRSHKKKKRCFRVRHSDRSALSRPRGLGLWARPQFATKGPESRPSAFCHGWRLAGTADSARSRLSVASRAQTHSEQNQIFRENLFRGKFSGKLSEQAKNWRGAAARHHHGGRAVEGRVER